jgi:hypothetical protein
MASTNFDLAPPAKTVDGLVAVPIDIQHIAATLTFDGATSSGTGDATLQFVHGPQNGNPIFDLRQTITGVWLDGAPLAAGKAAHHDFGGGPNAELRVVESVLAAGSAHTLRVTYSLGPPQASTAGSYQPAMTWSAGPRLAFNFGFTDLGAGRYLEAWVPANLIFDQFALDLELQVMNTAVAHMLITNGGVTSLGANHWSVSFPARFTALSTLLELRAADSVTSLTDTTTLPVSGAAVTIETWKLAGSGVNLAGQITNLKTWLAENETFTGPYLHDGRFVTFFNVGGMEYEGGTTCTTGSVRHETFHSWWGRGAKPAAQTDGWWDEAWNVYHDLGFSGSLPFDFTDPVVELSSRNPWVRVTPPGAYTSGERFFEGVASMVGVTNLKSHLSAFYKQHEGRPTTTADMEAFLVCRSGEPSLVDAYHRFVYGFPDPSPAPDLWIKDDPGDPGGNLWAGRFWDSPDLWIRNNDDGGTTHQPVEHGQDNWFYARVRNRSASATARHFLVTFNVKTFAGTEFVYPGDFLPCIAAAPGFELGPGTSTVVKARWPAALVPPVGTHACWLAAVLTRSDEPGAALHVWEHNNLAQKNLAVVDLVPDGWVIVPLVLNRIGVPRPRQVILELVRPPRAEELRVSLLHRSGRALASARVARERHAVPNPTLEALDCGGADADEIAIRSALAPPALAARHFEGAVEAPFEPGPTARIPLVIKGGGQLAMGLRLQVPRGAKPGETFVVDLVQRDEQRKRVVGGLAIQVRVRKET